ncbi:MAG: DUF2459 domain-containing protein [Steroidobacteraceae bacterium]
MIRPAIAPAIRRAIKPLRRPAAWPAGIYALAWLGICAVAGGCAEIPRAPPPPPPSFLASPAHRAPLAIGVLVAGWHSGLVLPGRELGPLASLLSDSQATYLSIGWGNRRFYMASHPGAGDALAALFRSPSVLFLRRVSAPADLSEPGGHIRWLCANRQELWRVDSYLEGSLARPAGRLSDLGRGPLPGSVFYASRGHYSLVHTCNTWTVAALQYAGLPVHASGVILASQTLARIRGLRACPVPQ